MANWKYTLNISNIWNDDNMSAENKGKAVAAKIKQTFPSPWFDWNSNSYNEEIDELAEHFRDITGYDEVSPLQEFNDCMNELYSFGDQSIDPWKWPANKMAWIETTAREK